METESNATLSSPLIVQSPFLHFPPLSNIPSFNENEFIQWKRDQIPPSHATQISSVEECRLWSYSKIASSLIPSCDYYQFTITPVEWSDMKPMSSLHSSYESFSSLPLMNRQLQKSGMSYYANKHIRLIFPAVGTFNDPSLLLLLPTHDMYTEDVRFSVEPLRLVFLRNHRVINVYKKPLLGMTLSVSKYPNHIQTEDTLSLKTVSSKVWIDEVGIFFTRGFANIYHNMEAINSILHWVTNSVSRLRWIVIVHPTSLEPTWPEMYLRIVLQTIPKEYRPILIPYQRLQKLRYIHIRHVVVNRYGLLNNRSSFPLTHMPKPPS